MPLRLTVKPRAGSKVTETRTVMVGEEVLTIGRDGENELVLPDEFVSGRHAEIRYEGNGFILVDTNSTNGTYRRGSEEPIAPGVGARLSDGDVFELGEDYELLVSMAPGEDAQPSWASTWPPGSARDTERGAPFPRPGTPSMQPSVPASEETPGSQSELHWPPRPISGSEPTRIVPKETFHQSPIANGSAYTPPTQPEDLRWPPGPAGLSNAKSPAFDAAAERAGATGFPPLETSSQASRSDPEAIGALLDGLGIPREDVPPEMVGQFMETVGQLLRETVVRLMGILAARRELKRRLKAVITTFGPVGNNPLKPSDGTEESRESTDEALRQLLLGTRGYTKGLAALQEAFQDIEAHELAVQAGLEAALLGVLRQFDPGHLASQLPQEPAIVRVLPLLRDARCWRSYTEYFAKRKEAAEADILGEDFRAAYRAAELRFRGPR